MQVLNKKNAEVSRYFAPSGIHYTAENSSKNALHNMNTIEQTLLKGTINDRPLTNKERAILEQNYKYGLISSQVGLTYDLPEQDDKPFTW